MSNYPRFKVGQLWLNDVTLIVINVPAITHVLAMRTSSPTTRTALPFQKIFAHDSHSAIACFKFLCRSNPTNPFVTRERSEVFP